MEINLEAIKNAIESRKTRSAWSKGVTHYAIDLLDNIRDLNGKEAKTPKELETALLNGARNWSEYSWGGCALIYNGDIAARLCSPSEFRRTRGGQWRPNRRESWLGVQARALYQAFRLICRAAEGCKL